jgi:hypothetical protein
VVSRHAILAENQSLPLCRKESMSYQPKKGEVENDRKWMSMQDCPHSLERGVKENGNLKEKMWMW